MGGVDKIFKIPFPWVFHQYMTQPDFMNKQVCLFLDPPSIFGWGRKWVKVFRTFLVGWSKSFSIFHGFSNGI